METNDLRAKGFVFHHCRICRGATRHDLAAGVDAIREDALRSLRTEGDEEETASARVLLVEDDAEVSAVLSKALTGAGYEVSSAGNGREALALIAREDFDAILADVRLPELDGRGLFEFLAQNFPEARGRVVFLTADTGNPETMAFLKDSGRPYLTKPVELARLFAVLKELAPKEPEQEPQQEN
jgi:CheY-like chemotaxis protein